MSLILRIGFVLGLAVGLAACSGQATSSPKGDGTSTNVDGTTTGTSLTATTVGTSENAANSTGTSPTADNEGTGENTANSTGGGSNSDPECGDGCSPCNDLQRRYECAPLCVCEAINDTARDEHERLLTCDWEQPCDPVGLRYTANAGDPLYGIYGAECLFAAFRDRTAGRFDVTRDEYTGFFAEHSKYVFVLDGSDTMLVLSSGFSGGPGENLRLGFAVNSCTLADPSTFTQCIADPESCVHMTNWFDSCVEASDASCLAE